MKNNIAPTKVSERTEGGRGDRDYVGKPQEGKEGQKEQRSINKTKRKVEASRNNRVKSRDIKNTFHSSEVGDIKRQTSKC